MVHADRSGRRAEMSGAGADEMPTTLKTAAESYLRAKDLSRGTRNEYRDVLYSDYLVAVETDGKLAHPLEARWGDVRRDNAAAADGIITLRYGWSDITMRPCFVAAEVAAVLSGRGWPGPVRPCGPGCVMLASLSLSAG